MYRLQVKVHFDAAHYIKDYQGKCSREHGHRWGVEVVIEGKELHDCNMLVDFSAVKGALKTLLDTYLDHYQLNEKLYEDNLTAEFVAKWIYKGVQVDFMQTKLPAQWNLRLARVTVWESPDCGVSYDEETNEGTK